MKIENIKEYYRQNLPHIQPVGLTFFVTFRLYNSIPISKLFQLKQEFEKNIHEIKSRKTVLENKYIYEERIRFFAKYDALLDKVKDGPTFLSQPKIAQLVMDELHRFDDDLYHLITFSIMPNHVHLLLNTSAQIPDDIDASLWGQLDYQPLYTILKRIKGPTALYANRILKSSGRFWQKESYDHYVRNTAEYNNVIAYILNNPVKANIVDNWEAHPYTYLNPLTK